jgi:hypothetical protein
MAEQKSASAAVVGRCSRKLLIACAVVGGLLLMGGLLALLLGPLNHERGSVARAEHAS